MTDINTAATNTTTKTSSTGTKPVANSKKSKSNTKFPQAGVLFKTKIDIFTEDDQDEYIMRNDQIENSMNAIDGSMETIAFCLYWVYRKEAYCRWTNNFSSFAQYARELFGYSKTTSYSLLSIVERFASHDQDGNMLEQIDPIYRAYSFSKLSVMVGLTDEQIAGLKPEMSVRDIKKYVASLKEKPLPALPDGIGEEKTEDGSGEADNVVDSTDHFKHNGNGGLTL